MDLKSDPLEFYKAVQTTVRGNAGKSLTPVLKHWRYRLSGDGEPVELRAGSRRFLTRLGVLDSGADETEQHTAFHQLLARIARSTGEAPGIVSNWLELFASGEYGVMERGICAAEPFCAACPLNESCRYLASGGADARSFGQDLASELMRGPAGAADLRTSDLLAFAASGGKSGGADIARAEAALKACRGLRGLLTAAPDDLAALGFSDDAVARIQALGELCRAWAQETVVRGRQFRHGQDFYDFFHLRLRELKREVFIVVILDQKNSLLREETVSTGSLTETLVHPREVFVTAVRERAAAIAVVHNHPSGDPTPSSQDKAITKRLQAAAALIGIRLLDHVIIGDGRYFSFLEEDLME